MLIEFSLYDALINTFNSSSVVGSRGGSSAAATSKMEPECFVIIVIITKRSILDVAAAQDPSMGSNQMMDLSLMD